MYGLSLGNTWNAVSGQILGMAKSSMASFTPHVTETTIIYASPESSASYNTDTTTAESNNLNYGTPSTSCGGGTCDEYATSTN
jgi:hypothetical protein